MDAALLPARGDCVVCVRPCGQGHSWRPLPKVPDSQASRPKLSRRPVRGCGADRLLFHPRQAAWRTPTHQTPHGASPRHRGPGAPGTRAYTRRGGGGGGGAGPRGRPARGRPCPPSPRQPLSQRPLFTRGRTVFPAPARAFSLSARTPRSEHQGRPPLSPCRLRGAFPEVVSQGRGRPPGEQSELRAPAPVPRPARSRVGTCRGPREDSRPGFLLRRNGQLFRSPVERLLSQAEVNLDVSFVSDREDQSILCT